MWGFKDLNLSFNCKSWNLRFSFSYRSSLKDNLDSIGRKREIFLESLMKRCIDIPKLKLTIFKKFLNILGLVTAKMTHLNGTYLKITKQKDNSLHFQRKSSINWGRNSEKIDDYLTPAKNCIISFEIHLQNYITNLHSKIENNIKANNHYLSFVHTLETMWTWICRFLLTMGSF